MHECKERTLGKPRVSWITEPRSNKGKFRECAYLRSHKVQLSLVNEVIYWTETFHIGKTSISSSVMSDSATPWIVARLLCPCDSPGNNSGVGCHSILQGIFPTQESNPGLLHCRQILYCLSPQGSPQNRCLTNIYRHHVWIKNKRNNE